MGNNKKNNIQICACFFGTAGVYDDGDIKLLVCG